MTSLPAWAIPVEADDYGEATKEYYRSELERRSSIIRRQAYRRIKVEAIKGAEVEIVDGHPMILGEPWFNAWLTMAVFLAVDGKFHEIEPDPRAWLAKKML